MIPNLQIPEFLAGVTAYISPQCGLTEQMLRKRPAEVPMTTACRGRPRGADLALARASALVRRQRVRTSKEIQMFRGARKRVVGAFGVFIVGIGVASAQQATASTETKQLDGVPTATSAAGSTGATEAAARPMGVSPTGNTPTGASIPERALSPPRGFRGWDRRAAGDARAPQLAVVDSWRHRGSRRDLVDLAQSRRAWQGR